MNAHQIDRYAAAFELHRAVVFCTEQEALEFAGFMTGQERRVSVEERANGEWVVQPDEGCPRCGPGGCRC